MDQRVKLLLIDGHQEQDSEGDQEAQVHQERGQMPFQLRVAYQGELHAHKREAPSQTSLWSMESQSE